VAKRNESAAEGKVPSRASADPAKEQLGREGGSASPADNLAQIETISPAFGFLFARRPDGLVALYRIAVSPEGDLLHSKELRVSHTRTVINLMVHELRKLVSEGAFRMSELSWLGKKVAA
jgi:hypothetical protein